MANYGDIDVNFDIADDADVVFAVASDIAVDFDIAAAIAVNFPYVPSGYISWCVEYLAVYNSWTNKPSDLDGDIQNLWVQTLVTAGLWTTKKDVQYNFAIHSNDDGEAQTNWLNPGTYDCTNVNACTFTQYEGFNGGGVGHLDTNFDLYTNGVLYTQNDDSLGIYIRTDTSGGQDISVRGTNNLRTLIIAKTSNVFYSQNNSLANFSAANTDSRGFYIKRRTASNAYSSFKNAVKLGDDTDITGGLPNDYSIYIGARNNKGSADEFTQNQYSCAFLGASEDNTEVTNETNAFEAYMDSNGKGVIS